MFCPTCGSQNPDNFRYCHICGKSPTATIKPSASVVGERKPTQSKEKSDALRNTVLSVIGLVIALVMFDSLKSAGVAGVSTREPITPENFTVPAGRVQYFTFTLSGPGRVVGKFEATGGSGNDIESVITDADNFENWKNGHQARVFYQSGRTTVGNVNALLNPGRYYLAFNNRFSVLTSKRISSDIAVLQ